MTDAQLYTAIGAPIIALIFAMVINFSLISRIDKRIDDMGSRLDQRISDVRGTLEAKIGLTESNLRLLIEKNHSEMIAKFVDLGHRLSRI